MDFFSISLVFPLDIVLLDQPTKGMDIFDTFFLVEYLRQWAARGRIVVMTIHPPTYEIFTMISRGKLRLGLCKFISLVFIREVFLCNSYSVTLFDTRVLSQRCDILPVILIWSVMFINLILQMNIKLGLSAKILFYFLNSSSNNPGFK